MYNNCAETHLGGGDTSSILVTTSELIVLSSEKNLVELHRERSTAVKGLSQSSKSNAKCRITHSMSGHTASGESVLRLHTH